MNKNSSVVVIKHNNTNILNNVLNDFTAAVVASSTVFKNKFNWISFLM